MRWFGWVVSSFVLVMTSACGDDSVTSSSTQSGSASASTGASSTAAAGSSSTSPTGTSAGGSSGSVSDGETSAPGSSSEGPTTGDASGSTGGDSTGASASTTADPTTSTSGDPTTSTSGDPTTSTSGDPTTSTSGGGQPPPPPALPEGCEFCECCDPWPIAWQASPGATHYVVRWKCSINPEQVIDVGDMTTVKDVCNDINMCNGMCAFTVGYIKVEACNENGCSAPIDIPPAEIPISCGGGCCC